MVESQKFSSLFKYKNKKKNIIVLQSSNKFKTKLLNSKISNKYNLCLIRTGRRKNPFFKVVVTNYNRKKIDIIGIFLPIAHLYKKEGLFFYQNSSLLQRKQLNIDFEKLFFWLRKRVMPSIFVYHLIRSIEQSFFFLTSQTASVITNNNKCLTFDTILKNSFIQEYCNE